MYLFKCHSLNYDYIATFVSMYGWMLHNNSLYRSKFGFIVATSTIILIIKNFAITISIFVVLLYTLCTYYYQSKYIEIFLVYISHFRYDYIHFNALIFYFPWKVFPIHFPAHTKSQFNSNQLNSITSAAKCSTHSISTPIPHLRIHSVKQYTRVDKIHNQRLLSLLSK